MAPGEMQINGCVIERGMAEQYLNGAQVRAGFEQVCGVSYGARHSHTTHDLHTTKICYRYHPFYGVEVEVSSPFAEDSESVVLIVRLPGWSHR